MAGEQPLGAEQSSTARGTGMGSMAAALAEFPVSGMRSQQDADLVAESLMRIAGVRSAQADHFSGRARVGFDPSRITMQTIRETAAATREAA